MEPLISFMLAVVFTAAYVHVRIPSRRRSGGALVRLILAGGACLWLFYGLYELSVRRRLDPESVPIRVELVFLGPALVALVRLCLAAIFGPFLGFAR